MRIRTLIVLHVFGRRVSFDDVASHHIVIHERWAPEETETAGATQHTPVHVFSRLLQPMGDGVLEVLVPYDGTYNIRVQYVCDIFYTGFVVDNRASEFLVP